jgi:hypothetical protein
MPALADGAGARNRGWEFAVKYLFGQERFSHQLGEKPCEIKSVQWTT